MATRWRVPIQTAYNKLIDEYKTRIKEEKSPKPTESMEEVVTSTDSVSKSAPPTIESDSEVEVKSKPVSCVNNGCRKKTKDSCIRSMCFICCYESCKSGDSKSIMKCDFHHADSVKRDKENELIEESLRSKQKERKLPRMREEKFTNAGQTVVIWCFRDFCQNKKWHEDTFNAQSRQLRQLKSLQKRHSYWKDSMSKDDDKCEEMKVDKDYSSIEEEYHDRPKKKSKVSNGRSRAIVSSRGKRCVERYQKVLKQWQEKLGEVNDEWWN